MKTGRKILKRRVRKANLIYQMSKWGVNISAMVVRRIKRHYLFKILRIVSDTE